MAELSPRLRARLAKVPDIIREAAASAMEECAAEIVAEMKMLVPVDSGDLRDSIGWTWGDIPAGSFMIDEIRSGKNAGQQYATLRIKIYAGNKEAFYARFIEFGTAPHSLARGADRNRAKLQDVGPRHLGAPAQPFFYAGYRKWGDKAKFRSRIRAAIRKRIKEAMNG